MTQPGPQSPRKFRGKLARKTLLLLLPIMMIPVAILGLVTLYNSSNFLRQQIIGQFTNVSDTLAGQINDLIDEQRAFFDELTADPDFNDSLDNVIATDPHTPDGKQAREQFLQVYNAIAHAQPQHNFSNLVIVGTDNTVLVATKPDWEGKRLDPQVFGPLLDDSRSLLLYNHYPFNFPLHDEIDNSLIMLTSQRVLDESGNLEAVLIGTTNTPKFQRILEASELAHSEARTYFITNLSGKPVFMGMLPTNDVPSVFIPSSDHLDYVVPALVNNPDVDQVTVEYNSFNNIPVLGMAQNFPNLDAALVFEVPQTVLTEPVREAFNQNIYLIIITLLVTAAIIWYGTQRMVRPIVEVATTAQHFADGDMRVRATVNRNDEIGLLAYTFNYLADQLAALYRSMETTIESRTRQIRAAAEVAQISTSTDNLDEILTRIVQLVVERFGYYHAAIFMLDRTDDHVVLMQAAGKNSAELTRRKIRIPVGGQSIIGTVAANNRYHLAFDVKQDPYYLPDAALPETQSEIAVPLSVGSQVLGVLDIQTNELHTFDEDEIATLQTLAQQIASAVRNIRLLENTRIDLQSTSLLYQASHQLASAETSEEVLQTLVDVFRQVPYMWAIFEREANILRVAGRSKEFEPLIHVGQELPASDAEVEKLVSLASWDLIRTDDPPEELWEGLLTLAQGAHCQAFVLMPFLAGDRVLGGIMLGAETPETLTPANLDAYHSIIEMANTALEKITAIAGITQSYAELQSLNSIGQAITTETDLDTLFEILHRQIVQVIGKVNFLVALYDAETSLIEVPYMTENDQIVSVPAFPLGRGLTSIVIRSRQPLMIVENTVERARALGAIITGNKPAKSWLGVPMIIAGDIVGAVVVQDTEHERRFDDSDLRLLTALAAQVAPVVRNARLLSEAQAAAERDRRLFEITDRIRQATSFEAILEITTRELGEMLDLRKAKIEIRTNPARETEENAE